MAEAQTDADKTRRKQSRATRRQQLIEATIRVIAREGYARTTLTRVAQEAGLSHGLVNFHFKSKELLLAETLQFLAEEYRLNWVQALESAPPDPAAKVNALLVADFEPSIITPDRLSAWCSFWGEAQCRPLYQESCSSNDEEYVRVLEDFCKRLMEDGGYPGDHVVVARALRVSVEGIWLDMMTMRAPYRREEALRTIRACAAAFFPGHFGPAGLITQPGRARKDSDPGRAAAPRRS